MTIDHFLPNTSSEMTLLFVDLMCLIIGFISVGYFISKYILVMTAVSISLTVVKKIYDFLKPKDDKRPT